MHWYAYPCRYRPISSIRHASDRSYFHRDKIPFDNPFSWQMYQQDNMRHEWKTWKQNGGKCLFRSDLVDKWLTNTIVEFVDQSTVHDFRKSHTYTHTHPLVHERFSWHSHVRTSVCTLSQTRVLTCGNQNTDKNSLRPRRHTWTNWGQTDCHGFGMTE